MYFSLELNFIYNYTEEIFFHRVNLLMVPVTASKFPYSTEHTIANFVDPCIATSSLKGNTYHHPMPILWAIAIDLINALLNIFQNFIIKVANTVVSSAQIATSRYLLRIATIPPLVAN